MCAFITGLPLLRPPYWYGVLIRETHSAALEGRQAAMAL